jgi:hypothetical protein
MPSFLMRYNGEGPKFHGDSEWVTAGLVDGAVVERWNGLYKIMTEAEKVGKLIVTDGMNYPAKCKAFLLAGNDVFMTGQWRKIGELAYVGGE